MYEKSDGSADSPVGARRHVTNSNSSTSISAHRRIRDHAYMVSISAQAPSCGEQRAQIAQGAPRRQQKMVRHLRSLHHGRELADAIPPARPMRASGRMRGHASRATQKTDLSESAEFVVDRRPPDAGLTGTTNASS